MNIRIEEDEHKTTPFDQKKRKLVILSVVFLVLTIACAAEYFLVKKDDSGGKVTSQKEAEKIAMPQANKTTETNGDSVNNLKEKIVINKVDEKPSAVGEEEENDLNTVAINMPSSDDSITKEEEVAPLVSEIFADTQKLNTDDNPEPLPIETETETNVNSSPSQGPAQPPQIITRFQPKPIPVDIDDLADDAMDKDAELKRLVESYSLAAIKRHFNSVTLQMYQQRDDVNLFKARVLAELQKRATKPMDVDVVLEKDEELEAYVDLGLEREMLSRYNGHTVYDLGISADLIAEIRDELIERTRGNHSTLTPGSKDEDESTRYIRSDIKAVKNVRFNEDENTVREFEKDSAPNGEEIIEDYEEYW